MGPIEHIRKSILDLSQTELGVIAGTTQATVSRWESGQLEPSRTEMSRIRDAVIARGMPWNDAWFFEAPSRETTAESALA